jgi:membrane-associated phospholipid phosphatase
VTGPREQAARGWGVTGSDRLASVLSEALGPAPLLIIGILEVGIAERSGAPTFIALVSMAIIPYLALILLSRSGRVTDRFAGDRRQRVPVLIGTLVVVLGGLVTLVVIQAPAALIMISAAAVLALLIVTGITFVWKISIHATVATFFAGMQIVLYGQIGLAALVLPLAVSWARYRLGAHTTAQLVAGSMLGGILAIGYAIATAHIS